jgi:hypothetical protein
LNYEVPELKAISKEAKDLIYKILLPADKRISIKEIFEHPWMNVNLPTTTQKVSFRKMHEFSKFSKVSLSLFS